MRSAQSVSGYPQVTTSEVTSYGYSTATLGGEVVSVGGSIVTERGMCWSVKPHPTKNDHYGVAESGQGGFVVIATELAPSTTYYVRACATNASGTAYGNEVSFTTTSGGDHGYVDLGLPSGTLWATCNLGASSPEEYGDYYAWGETQPKTIYDWNTYKYCVDGDCNKLTKYCHLSSYGYNGFTDNLSVLLPEDDAATASWGNGWSMPTIEQYRELYQHTIVTWTTQNGVEGELFTVANGNSLFMPAAGYRSGGELKYAGEYGRCWSSSRAPNTYVPYQAQGFSFYSGDYQEGIANRYFGRSVRPVRSSSQK